MQPPNSPRISKLSPLIPAALCPFQQTFIRFDSVTLFYDDSFACRLRDAGLRRITSTDGRCG
ncbi:hypothetical protein HanIR_Chr14g0674241 [Helianthus annuus]|nr:hypothetical protein HanIR_Chr14g0674241 [Helianthus annuus]